MDNENENIARRDELLARFRESLAQPMSERYFDISELVDIFDYAGDLGDDYLRMEALMVASRYYADNEDMLERKAIFYSQYSDDTSTKYLTDNFQAKGMIWDLLRERQWMPDDEAERQRKLDEIVDAYDSFTDEEVVQLLDLVSRYGMIQWLKANMPKLREKVDYLNMLLYEAAIAADANQDVHMSVQLLEELTELEPYNIYFWTLLSKAYAALDEGEKAMSAIEYALAINPDDGAALLLKAKLLYVKDSTDAELPQVLKHALDQTPTSTEAVRLLASVYYSQGHATLSRETLNDYLLAHPESATDIIPDLLLLRPLNVKGLLDQFYAANEENSQLIWASWAHQLARSGYPDLGMAVLEAYHRNSGMKIYTTFPIEAAFIQEHFDIVIELLNDYLENNSDNDTDHNEFPSLVLMHLMSMIRLGEMEKARMFCDFIERESNIQRFTTLQQRLSYYGLLKIVRQIKNKLKRTTDPAEWQGYDPLELWD